MLKKTLLTAIALLGGILAHGQIRTSSDSANGNFVIGIDNYLKVSTASTGTAAFDFSTQGKAFKAIARDGSIFVLDKESETPVLEGIHAMEEIIIGIHDFTNDRQPELVIALRIEDLLQVDVFQYDKDGEWDRIGEIRAGGEGVRECRIFRQVLTVERGKDLYTWTFRSGKFNFRSSDGSTDPATAQR